MEKYHGNTVEYWKQNAEEDYIKTPISVLKYITVLEEQAEKLRKHAVVGRSEQLFCVCPPMDANFTYDGLLCDWCTNCGRKAK
jgi:hypothetical protein